MCDWYSNPFPMFSWVSRKFAKKLGCKNENSFSNFYINDFYQSFNRTSTGKSFSEARNICRACCVPKLFWMSKQNKNNLCTQHVLQVFWAYNFHEQSVVILWVSWCKNKSFWQRFTCTWHQKERNHTFTNLKCFKMKEAWLKMFLK